jgi:hypothetical protein
MYRFASFVLGINLPVSPRGGVSALRGDAQLWQYLAWMEFIVPQLGQGRSVVKGIAQF